MTVQRRGSPKSPVLTYNGFATIITGSPTPSKRRNNRSSTFCKSLLVCTFLAAACFLVSHNPDVFSSHHAKRRMAERKINELLGNVRRRLPVTKEKIQLRYTVPESNEYSRTAWTSNDFSVSGVNLAQYGLENEGATHKQRRVTAVLNQVFELYQDFDISSFLEGADKVIEQNEQGQKEEGNTRSPEHLLMYRRHLENPSLAFYLDRIAQKKYLKSIGIPAPLSHVAMYRDELYSRAEQSDAEREAEIRKLLPEKSAYVIKSSHKRGESILVSYHDESGSRKMKTQGDSNFRGQEYNADAIAHQITEALKPSKTHFLDPWPYPYVQPGLLIEDRLTGFESVDHPPMKLSVYVIWGHVWMANWRNAEGTGHAGMVFPNGTVVMDDLGTLKIPRWAKWELIMQRAEEIAAQKDILQVDFLVGVTAETAHKLTHATRQEKLAKVQIVVSDVKLMPDSKFPHDGLMNEMGRLWIAGYEMGIYKSVPNDEVPTEYLQHHLVKPEASMTL
jgi:hypothetical protein